jgi:hypothetical protein
MSGAFAASQMSSAVRAIYADCTLSAHNASRLRGQNLRSGHARYRGVKSTQRAPPDPHTTCNTFALVETTDRMTCEHSEVADTGHLAASVGARQGRAIRPDWLLKTVGLLPGP